ncbi:MAG: hypothetical protein QOE23_1626 [Pseudonocardiales bacterium]|nr:hypothetical protein [Pseudonocardiales bacterium]
MTGTAPQVAPPSAAGQSVVTVGQFLTILRRQLGLLLLMMLLGVLAAGLLLLNTAKTYQATAVVDISPTSGAAASTVSTITESRIVTSTSVASEARQTLAFPGTPTELARQVTVSSPLASQVLNITFAAGTAQGAADGANAFANAYLDYRTLIAQKDITLRIGRIQSQVADLQRSLATLKTGQNDTQRGLLQNQIQQLQNQLNTYQTSVVTPGQVAGAAVAPGSPSSPRPPLYLAGGLLIGLLVGIVLAVMRDRRDDRVRTASELEHNLGAPVIIESPTSEGDSRPAAITAARSAEADAYRTLGTAVTAHRPGSRIVLLCGTGEDGDSLAPVNLAATFAMQGLSTVLAGPQQAVQPALDLLGASGQPAGWGTRLVDQSAATEVPGLRVLSLGDEVSLGATLRTYGDSLADVLDTADVIVLDGMNVELASSSVRLGQLADEAVVVAYRNRSTHTAIERLGRQLAQVGVPVLGGVLLGRRGGLRGKLNRGGENPPRRAAAGPSHREATRSAQAAGPQTGNLPGTGTAQQDDPAFDAAGDSSSAGGPRIGQPTVVGSRPSGSSRKS